MNALVATNADAYRASTDAAGLCREIVVQKASNIQGKRYVNVEGWQAIAIAHGCAASALDVERVEDEGMSGFKCTGVVRRMSDGQEIARGEGFLGDDEPTWKKRPVYARRAMVQTRAISRACRSAFAHVVVMIDANLSTTPAEEVPHGGFNDVAVEGEYTVVKEPVARTKLDGEHTSKTALREAINDVIAKVRKAETVEALDALKTEHKRTINQALRDWPALINGHPDIPQDTGLKGAIEIRRKALTDNDALAVLVDAMKMAQTQVALAKWMEAAEPAIDALDDADRRIFERERDAFEAGLEVVAAVKAG